MMKMYHRAANASDAAFWEATWNDGQLEEAIRFCAADPLRPLFERYTRAGTRLLEGGCGRGHYVVYYGARGVRVTGLDFATSALHRLKHRNPETTICAGDVSALPLRDRSYDVYYSGGVVEHFECGPLPALKEAFRVLRPGGVLLVGVPYLSPLRWAAALWRRDRRFVPDAQKELETPTGEFWQYAFGTKEFSALLGEAGFVVERTFPYGILFGLHDIAVVARLLSRRPTMRTPSLAISRPESAVAPSGLATRRFSLLKRLAVSEDRRVPLIGPLVEGVARLCANMMLYVAVRPDEAPTMLALPKRSSL